MFRTALSSATKRIPALTGNRSLSYKSDALQILNALKLQKIAISSSGSEKIDKASEQLRGITQKLEVCHNMSELKQLTENLAEELGSTKADKTKKPLLSKEQGIQLTSAIFSMERSLGLHLKNRITSPKSLLSFIRTHFLSEKK